MVQRYGRFSAAVSGIAYCIQKIETEEMAKHGLTGTFAQYLAALVNSEKGLTVSGLSKACMKDKAAVSRAVAQLEAKGLVSRNSVGASLYRVPVTLTDKGREIAGYVAKRAADIVEIAGVGEEEREKFYSALDTIAANLTRMCEDGLPE